MKVDRKELTGLLRIIKPGIDKNAVNINGMDCFIFMDGRIHAHDDAVSLSVQSPLSGNFAVSALEFYSILSRFKNDTVEVEEIENGLSLKCGKAKASILFRKDDVSARIKTISPDPSNWKELCTRNFNEILAMTYVHCSAMSTADKIGGVLIQDDILISSDNSSIARYKIGEILDRMWLGVKAINIIKGIEKLTHYCIIGSWVHFKSDTVQVSCRKLVDERYPFNQYKGVLAAVQKSMVGGTFTQEFVETIGRASIFAKDKDGDLVLHLTFGENSIIVTSDSGSGSFEEEVEAVVLCEEPTTICLSATRLKYALSKWESIDFNVGHIGDNPVLILNKDGYTEVIMLHKE
jgi:DNA polymerase III sliding clamp (beta) subunit (PCNA family)